MIILIFFHVFFQECVRYSFSRVLSSNRQVNRLILTLSLFICVIYANNIEASKITSDWFLWIHHTTDKIPDKNDKKYSWQKKHKENKTGSAEAYKPVKIKKNDKIKKYESWK